jgi:hypothetical protein
MEYIPVIGRHAVSDFSVAQYNDVVVTQTTQKESEAAI